MTDEKELMLSVQKGNLDDLAVLFENNHVQLYHYFLRTGNSRAVSDDLVQETFVKVLAYRSSFNGTASFRSWLYGIARNTTADYYRKTKHSRQYEDIDEHEVDANICLTEQIAGEQQQVLFDKSLASIPSDQREILILSRYAQLNYQEIADMNGCNLNTLKARMCKAVTNLQIAYRRLSKEIKQ